MTMAAGVRRVFLKSFAHLLLFLIVAVVGAPSSSSDGGETKNGLVPDRISSKYLLGFRDDASQQQHHQHRRHRNVGASPVADDVASTVESPPNGSVSHRNFPPPFPAVDAVVTNGTDLARADTATVLATLQERRTSASDGAGATRDRAEISLELDRPDLDELASGDSRMLIYIQGLFELTQSGRSVSGRAELAAARLALRHVNRDRVIPGYRLLMYVNNTEGDTGVGVDAFFHALYRRPQMLMLLGSASSSVTEQLAQIVSFWNVIQVSFGSTSPALSDRQSFPLFYRTVAPDSSHNPARGALVRRFGWDTVSILCQNDEAFTLGIGDLVQQLEQSNISVATTVIFAQQNYKERLAQLKNTDCRVIFGSFMEELAEDIFCEA